jgi:hypothetical protein
MSVRRERVDPVRATDPSLLVHRRWLFPDDVTRVVPLSNLSRLWRTLFDLSLLNPSEAVAVERLWLPAKTGDSISEEDMPALASAGALLAGARAATLLTQMVWLKEEDRKDPYTFEGVSDPPGFRDYTLYAVADEGSVLVPVPAAEILCGACKQPGEPGPGSFRFGEAMLLTLARACPSCGATLAPDRDKVLLRSGATYLLSEASARAALSVELVRAPRLDELPEDGPLARALSEAFGGYDELADDQVPPAG